MGQRVGVGWLASAFVERGRVGFYANLVLLGKEGLSVLLLRETRVTDEGVKKLQQALPNCEIGH